MEAITATGSSLRILDLGVDTAAPTGKLLLTVLGGIAALEREIMLERQREGIAKDTVKSDTGAGKTSFCIGLTAAAAARNPGSSAAYHATTIKKAHTVYETLAAI